MSFGLVYFMNNLLYKPDKKSLFFTSLGDFPIDPFLRQFMVETVFAIWEQNFHIEVLLSTQSFSGVFFFEKNSVIIDINCNALV